MVSDSIFQAANICVYNKDAANTIYFHVCIERGGLLHRFHYKAALGVGLVDNGCNDLWLTQGDKLTMRCLGSGADTDIEIAFQLLKYS